ncbi:MAG: universal stress protein [Chloroflexi bacterium]|nr:universal stress protein [Chloroflexota bacterium]
MSNLDYQAVQDFRTARFQANVERIRAALSRESADLLSYEDVRKKLHATETNRRQLKTIPLNAIVGSVGRYTDFTRRFFPRQENDEERWTRIRMRAESLEGFPPIEAFQLGDVYFIIDGNHRASVVRSLGGESIEAYVTEVKTDVSLSPDTKPDELIIIERYTIFLEKSGLKKPYPEINLKMSEAGNYRFLEYQIKHHQQWMDERPSYQDAATDWYKNVYSPVIQIIRKRGILRNFPHRSETDLFVWIEKHRERLNKHVGWSLDADTAAIDLAENYSQRPASRIQRASKKIIHAVTPAVLDDGPMPGEWRKVWLSTNQGQSLFRHILVGINAKEGSWAALDQALDIAAHEKSQIHGLHIVDNETDLSPEKETEIRSLFEEKCQDAAVNTGLRFKQGNVTQTLRKDARWVDLVILSLTHPPGPRPLNRLISGFSQLVRRCSRPILAVPQNAKKISHILLAYDDSNASKEALYVAAHLSKDWKMPLNLLSVQEDEKKAITPSYAQEYLEEKKIQANFINRQGEAAEEILKEAKKQDTNLIIMGSYGYNNPIMEVALGSTVDEVLRNSENSVLICR